MLDLVKAVANTWFTWWMVGLLISFRMIVPARNFLSERSAKWLAHRLTQARGISTRRRFDLSFKRYVDRTFHARQVKIRRCRVWTLRYRNTAFVSLLTFLVIYSLVLLTLDFDQLYYGVETLRARIQDPASPEFDESVAGFVALIGHLDTSLIVATMMIFYGVIFGLFNTLTDYVSFIETRNLLARLGRGPWRDILWITVDLLLTTVISIGGFVILWVAVTYFGSLLSERSLSISVVAHEGVGIGLAALANAASMMGENRPELNPTDPAMISMTLSTYATSIWIWVFFASTLAIRGVVLATPVLRFVTFLIDVEVHPFRAAWLMFAFMWTIGIGVCALL
jgi:hypothetical protein